MARDVSKAWLRFKSGNRDYAMPLEIVAEVTAAHTRRLIPFVPLRAGGVINVKGEPLAAADGGVVLRGKPSPSGTSRHALVLERGPLRVGLLVDSVQRVERDLDRRASAKREVEDGSLATPEFVHWSSREGQLIGLLDPDGLLSRVADLLTPRPVAAQQRGDEPWPDAF
jgi:chemotaxis signal transduction protein